MYTSAGQRKEDIVSIYNSQEWKELEAKLDVATAEESKAVKAFHKADNKLAVDDPKLAKARQRMVAAEQVVRDLYAAMAALTR